MPLWHLRGGSLTPVSLPPIPFSLPAFSTPYTFLSPKILIALEHILTIHPLTISAKNSIFIRQPTFCAATPHLSQVLDISNLKQCTPFYISCSHQRTKSPNRSISDPLTPLFAGLFPLFFKVYPVITFQISYVFCNLLTVSSKRYKF